MVRKRFLSGFINVVHAFNKSFNFVSMSWWMFLAHSSHEADFCIALSSSLLRSVTRTAWSQQLLLQMMPLAFFSPFGRCPVGLHREFKIWDLQAQKSSWCVSRGTHVREPFETWTFSQDETNVQYLLAPQPASLNSWNMIAVRRWHFIFDSRALDRCSAFSF